VIELWSSLILHPWVSTNFPRMINKTVDFKCPMVASDLCEQPDPVCSNWSYTLSERESSAPHLPSSYQLWCISLVCSTGTGFYAGDLSHIPEYLGMCSSDYDAQNAWRNFYSPHTYTAHNASLKYKTWVSQWLPISIKFSPVKSNKGFHTVILLFMNVYVFGHQIILLGLAWSVRS